MPDEIELPPHSLQDTVLRHRIAEIVKERGIKVIVETGLDKGLSTIVFSRIAETVVGIDNHVQAVVDARVNLNKAGVSNATTVLSSSPDALKALGPLLPDETLYFLDAHWQQYWPILDEIRAVRPGIGVIVIHDMKVPDHPELGYDSYGGYDLDEGFIRDSLLAWSPTYRVEYNDRAEGVELKRGCGFFFPE